MEGDKQGTSKSVESTKDKSSSVTKKNAEKTDTTKENTKIVETIILDQEEDIKEEPAKEATEKKPIKCETKEKPVVSDKKKELTKFDPKGKKINITLKENPAKCVSKENSAKGNKIEAPAKDDKKKEPVNIEPKEETTKAGKEKESSPLAKFFKNWDSFTEIQKKDIERYIRKKAEEMLDPKKSGKEKGIRWWRWRRNTNSRQRRSAYRRREIRPYPRRRWPEVNPWAASQQSATPAVSQLVRQLHHLLDIFRQSPLMGPSRADQFSKSDVNDRPPHLPPKPPGYQSSSTSRSCGQYINSDQTSREYEEKSNYSSLQLPQRSSMPSPRFTVKVEDSGRRFSLKSPRIGATSFLQSSYGTPPYPSSSRMNTDLSWSERLRASQIKQLGKFPLTSFYSAYKRQ